MSINQLQQVFLVSTLNALNPLGLVLHCRLILHSLASSRSVIFHFEFAHIIDFLRWK